MTLKHRLGFAAISAMGLMILLFSSLMFFVEGRIDLFSYVAILITGIGTVTMAILFFFAGDDALFLAKYNFFKKRGGGLVFEGYDDRTLKLGYKRNVPKKVDFEKSEGEDEPEWAEKVNKPWYVRGTGIPVFFFWKGIPYNVSPFETYSETGAGELINKAIIRAKEQGKIESLRKFFDEIGADPKIFYMLCGVIFSLIILLLLLWNNFALAKAMAEKAGVKVAEHTFLLS